MDGIGDGSASGSVVDDDERATPFVGAFGDPLEEEGGGTLPASTLHTP